MTHLSRRVQSARRYGALALVLVVTPDPLELSHQLSLESSAVLQVFYGENRLEAERAVRQVLGEGYEVYEGENLTAGDLPSIFRGTSLFGEERRILLKDVGENAEVWAKLADYRETEHMVVVWEGKIDKRSAGYKGLKEAGVSMQEFTEFKKPSNSLALEKTAL